MGEESPVFQAPQIQRMFFLSTAWLESKFSTGCSDTSRQKNGRSLSKGSASSGESSALG